VLYQVINVIVRSVKHHGALQVVKILDVLVDQLQHQDLLHQDLLLLNQDPYLHLLLLFLHLLLLFLLLFLRLLLLFLRLLLLFLRLLRLFLHQDLHQDPHRFHHQYLHQDPHRFHHLLLFFLKRTTKIHFQAYLMMVFLTLECHWCALSKLDLDVKCLVVMMSAVFVLNIADLVIQTQPQLCSVTG
jgi:hypothetical protein